MLLNSILQILNRHRNSITKLTIRLILLCLPMHTIHLIPCTTHRTLCINIMPILMRLLRRRRRPVLR